MVRNRSWPAVSLEMSNNKPEQIWVHTKFGLDSSRLWRRHRPISSSENWNQCITKHTKSIPIVPMMSSKYCFSYREKHRTTTCTHTAYRNIKLLFPTLESPKSKTLICRFRLLSPSFLPISREFEDAERELELPHPMVAFQIALGKKMPTSRKYSPEHNVTK